MTAMDYHIIKRNIRQYGQPVIVTKKGLNEFGEPITDAETIEFPGLFHEFNSSNGISISMEDGGKVQSIHKKARSVLCLQQGLATGDALTVNGRQFEIAGVTDLGNEHEVFILSLEEVELCST